ncbi:unnamed protein product [Durusdinium trenchii]|uniref:Uncharacterized protein n=1 Tax=Durusdinium trenchii TaxID=1381693 RepID=A0ABP0LW23_9DINO
MYHWHPYRHEGWALYIMLLFPRLRGTRGWDARTLTVVDHRYLKRLDCESKNWTTFRHLLEARIEAGGFLGRDAEVQMLAESLLSNSEKVFHSQELAQEFWSILVGERRHPYPQHCFPGYQAACLMRVLHLAAEEGALDPFDERHAQVRHLLQSNAQFCAGLFGKEAALEFLGSTRWPVQLLDFEIHLRNSTDLSVTKRYAESLPQGVETFNQLRRHWPEPLFLGPGSVDPQGISAACESCRARAGLPRAIRLLSVDGGHCALWLEPAVSFNALFPDMVSTQLATYRSDDACSSLMGDTAFKQIEVFSHQQYFSDNSLFRAADVLVGQWIGECSKLRVHYSKPVIAYLGFLLLNDPVVGKYHFWSEPLPHFWERYRTMQNCDVHAKGRQLDGGPPCAIVFEEPQLAEAAFWQTGFRNPSVRPLALYVGATHHPENASKDVLVINRARLLRDMHFTDALNAMKAFSYPHDFINQRRQMPFAEMATYKAAVMMPWDLNLVMFHDLYAMNLPLFLPDLAGLHRVAVTYFARFRMNTAHEGQPFSERGPWPSSPHPFSPFDLEFLEARQYWLHFTEYVRAPAVQHFASLPDLLLQVVELDGGLISKQMRAQNAECFRASQDFWLGVFGGFQLGQGRSVPAPLVLHFTNPWAENMCWHGGMSEERCCDTSLGAEGDALCFDDFWTFHRCCVHNLTLASLDDAACGTSGPYGTILESPLDGVPWVQAVPSQQEPFVFLWDEKSGGTAFMQWLKYSVWSLGKLESSFMYTLPGHPVAVGSPFYLKTASPLQRSNFQVLSGHFDWRVMHEGIDCQKRKKVRCFLLVRDPIERFLSYYEERTDRHFAKTLGRSPAGWSAAAWRFYLKRVARESLWYNGEETGLFCNRENMLCLDLEKTSHHPLIHRVRPDSVKERFYFRFLGGPQNRLTWMLDPEFGNAQRAIWRLRRCVVGLQTEHFQGFKQVLAYHFPWLSEVPKEMGARTSQKSRGSLLLSSLPHFARKLIARYNSKDMIVYSAARRQFRTQLLRIRQAAGEAPGMPPIANVTLTEAAAIVNKALSHTATFRNHQRLSEYLMR